MLKRILTGFTLAAISTPAAMGQTTTTTQTPAQEAAHQLSRLTTLLTLTSGQQALALPIFTAEDTTLAAIQTSLTAAHTALEAAIEKNDLTAINTEATLIGTLTTQQVTAQAKAEAAFYLLLTTAQQTVYNALKLDGFGGPGGIGGPGGLGGHH